MTDLQLKSYLGGIIDGQGSIFISQINQPNRPHQYHRLCVTVSMTSPVAIKLLQKHYPGNYNENAKTKTGKKIYVWSKFGKQAVQFLQHIQPFLLVKGNQLKIARKFQKTLGLRDAWSDKRYKYRIKLYQQLKRLHK